jgi:hypothetical protein
VKATWKKKAEIPLTWAYILAMLLGGTARPENLNPNAPGDISEFDEPSLTLLVEEGRRQIQEQMDRFKHVTDRAQVLLTVSIVLLGFLSATFQHANHASAWARVVALAVWSVAVSFALAGFAAAASVMVVPAEFEGIDTTRVSNWDPPILRRLAAAYSKAVVVGETTVAARLTLFQRATRLVCWAAVIAAVAFTIGGLP